MLSSLPSSSKYRNSPRYLLLAVVLLCTGGLVQPSSAQRPFVTTWKISDGNPTLTIPTDGRGVSAYDFTVDWGDGTIEEVQGEDPRPVHMYAQGGTYTVSITGHFPRFALQQGGFSYRLRDVKQWGDIEWESMENAFARSDSLTQLSAMDAPNLTGVESMHAMFYASGLTQADFSTWDVSEVTDMSYLFAASAFNGAVDSWDVSSVSNMAGMFSSARAFNQPIDTWDVSRVRDMRHMFDDASSFDQPIGNWDTSSVTAMINMFAGATSFNQPIGDWDISGVTDLRNVFSGATSFNQPLDTWDVSRVTEIDRMFLQAADFNQPLDAWDVSRVGSMVSMFQGAQAFNQPLEGWDVSRVTDMKDMFSGAVSFDQSLAAWQVANVADFRNFLQGVTLSTPHYDALLVAWAQQELPLFRVFHAGNARYSEAGRSARQYIRDHFGWTVFDGGAANLLSDEVFATVWRTFQPQTTIVIPTNGDGVRTYDFTIDWGDGHVEQVVGDDPDPSHTYAGPGTYTVQITGVFPRIAMNELDYWPKNYLTHLLQWGAIPWEDMEHAFADVRELRVLAQDAPDLSRVTSLHHMFRGALELNTDISDWDVSNVTDMSYMFEQAKAFNQPLDGWDVSQVTTMEGMFKAASQFNQPLATWSTENVTTMEAMFQEATTFDQPLEAWDMGRVANIDYMFAEARAFNQPLEQWDLGAVTTLTGVFRGTQAFDQDLNAWDVSHITDMTALFEQAAQFNQPLDAWDVSSVTSMARMFIGATRFNQPIDQWDVSNVQSMRYMFAGTGAFNQPIETWDTGRVRNMDYMFAGSGAFNGIIETWDVSNVEYMIGMFLGARAFNQPLEAWDVSKVQSMEAMFNRAEAFNQPLGAWDVSNVTHFNEMFRQTGAFNQSLNEWTLRPQASLTRLFDRARAFDQCLGGLNIEEVGSVSLLLRQVEISTANYDCTLQGWAQQQLPVGRSFDAGRSRYSAAAVEARQYLIDTFGWTITDGGLDPTAPVDTESAPETFMFALEAPYPNPASYTATIPFTLPPEAATFTLATYDVLGRRVTALRQGAARPGKYEAVLPTATLPSGTYFVRLTAGKQTQTQTLVVAR